METECTGKRHPVEFAKYYKFTDTKNQIYILRIQSGISIIKKMIDTQIIQ